MRESIHPKIEIIQQIIQERKAQGMTQQELADRVGLRQGNISRLECAKTNPTVDFLVRIANGLGKRLHIELR